MLLPSYSERRDECCRSRPRCQWQLWLASHWPIYPRPLTVAATGVARRMVKFAALNMPVPFHTRSGIESRLHTGASLYASVDDCCEIHAQGYRQIFEGLELDAQIHFLRNENVISAGIMQSFSLLLSIVESVEYFYRNARISSNAALNPQANPPMKDIVQPSSSSSIFVQEHLCLVDLRR